MSKPVILCVDDESIILNALKDQLQRKFSTEYDIENSDSGSDALEYIQELIADKIDVPLVIADYIMPGMRGDELLKNVHELSPNTLNILLTGQANIEGVTNAVNYASLYRYMSKPWDEDDLELTVKEALKSFYQKREIHQKNEELQELNASLEVKVQERTVELRALNATKDKFFSIIAHDLKNPFNALLGFSTLLLDDYDNFTDADRIDLIQTMSDASNNAYKLLQNLLEWSRSQTGSIQWEPDAISLHDIVTATIDLLSNGASVKEISINAIILPNIVVWADANMATTVIRNLISNALKYTPKGGEIRVYSKKTDKEIEVTIEDNGVGINETDKEKLFRIDVNHSTSGTNNEQGTGLGLILCKEFVEKNGGKIWVESIEGKGSKFKFTLPLYKEKQAKN
ncbi:MAG: hybrid sensor histidine kinase/response regulator [Bacteroidetes bacterium]|nr:hybrid sensor histidine kinase/response regulator [Bacteroidota bacterium]